jgi:hypothetical protein
MVKYINRMLKVIVEDADEGGGFGEEHKVMMR